MDALEREEMILEEALFSGEIDIREYNHQMRMLHEELED